MHSFFKPERNIAMTTTFTMRIDDELKFAAEDLFEALGLNITTAVTCFFKKCLDTGEIPFKISSKRREERLKMYLKEAEEVANDPNAPSCTDPDKLEEFLFS